MKFEIIKGTEADFEGAPEKALVLASTHGGIFFASGLFNGAIFFDGLNGWHMSNPENWKLIAERRPIADSQPDADGWIDWRGGNRPVPAGKKVDTRWQDGTIETDVYDEDYYWEHDNCTDSIIAYRLSKPEKPAAPAWNGEGLPPVGIECECSAPELWKKCKIKYTSDQLIVYQMIDTGYEYAASGRFIKFRPLPTPEEERKDYAVGALERAWEEVTDKPAFKFEVIYDAIAAGKIPGVVIAK